jgi:hypothetical protein
MKFLNKIIDSWQNIVLLLIFVFTLIIVPFMMQWDEIACRLFSNYLYINILLILIALSMPLFISFQKILNAKWSDEIIQNTPGTSELLKTVAFTWFPILLFYSFFIKYNTENLLFIKIWTYPVFLIIRTGAIILSWIYLLQSKPIWELSLRNLVKLLIIITLTLTIFCWDWMMLPVNEWISSILSVVILISVLQTGLSISILFNPEMKKETKNDSGKYLLTLSIVWMYLIFSQLLISRYGGNKIEFQVISSQFSGSHYYILILNLLFNFGIPLTLLFSSKSRNNYKLLKISALSIIFGQWLQIYLFVSPAFNYLNFSLIEFGFLYFYVFLLLKFLKSGFKISFIIKPVQ